MKLCEVLSCCLAHLCLWHYPLECKPENRVFLIPHATSTQKHTLLFKAGMGIHSHTHFITPLQGLIHSQANAKKSIYYLPLHNSPGRFILMPPACISFPFFVVVASFTPLQLPFSLSFSKKAPHYVTRRFLCASLSLCVRRRERSRVGVDLPKSVWTHALPHTHTTSVCQGRDW